MFAVGSGIVRFHVAHQVVRSRVLCTANVARAQLFTGVSSLVNFEAFFRLQDFFTVHTRERIFTAPSFCFVRRFFCTFAVGIIIIIINIRNVQIWLNYDV